MKPENKIGNYLIIDQKHRIKFFGNGDIKTVPNSNILFKLTAHGDNRLSSASASRLPHALPNIIEEGGSSS